MRILVTGATGFCGSHLVDQLLANKSRSEIEIIATRRHRSSLENLQHLLSNCHHLEEKMNGSLQIVEMDIEDLKNCIKIFKEWSPDRIFHLAAQTFVPTSWKAPQSVITTNTIGTLNILEASITAEIDPIILYAGSSEEYGKVFPNEVPITEQQQLRPISPYAVSKVAGELLCQQYHESYGLKIVTTRAFNHYGPRQEEHLVCAAFARQFARYELGLQEKFINKGNLDSRRDFTYVTDIANAYILAIEKCRYAEPYNICSGNDHSIEEIFYILNDLSIKKWYLQVDPDPKKSRPSDVKLLSPGNNQKFSKLTGWHPVISLKEGLFYTLEFWREKVHNTKPKE